MVVLKAVIALHFSHVPMQVTVLLLRRLRTVLFVTSLSSLAVLEREPTWGVVELSHGPLLSCGEFSSQT